MMSVIAREARTIRLKKVNKQKTDQVTTFSSFSIIGELDTPRSDHAERDAIGTPRNVWNMNEIVDN